MIWLAVVLAWAYVNAPRTQPATTTAIAGGGAQPPDPARAPEPDVRIAQRARNGHRAPALDPRSKLVEHWHCTGHKHEVPGNIFAYPEDPIDQQMIGATAQFMNKHARGSARDFTLLGQNLRHV